jgi:flagellum-specific ATP synthase
MAEKLDLAPYARALRTHSTVRRVGEVEKVVGLVIESRGPRVGVGHLCHIRVSRNGSPVLAEVVGFRGDTVQLMPYDSIGGIARGAEVTAARRPLTVPTGSVLLGRVIDAFGHPIDGRGLVDSAFHRPVVATPPAPLARQPVDRPLATGVRAIDAFLTAGRGQRIGIFSGSGVGKSMLLGMIARSSAADVNVIALVGERGREVRQFIERDLGAEGLARSVVVVATSDKTALTRIKAALAAMTIAEAFRDAGKNVMVLMDSVTRVAMALREIGLAVGEPPTSRGYTPSVFAFLPPYLERAGNAESGSVTAFITVLVEADDVNDPIGDAVRGILDGHIVLSRDLAAQNHYPAIDILGSVSRVMPDVVDREHLQAAATMRSILATYTHFEDLITVGAYRSGQNPELDRAIHFVPRLKALVAQPFDQGSDYASARDSLVQLAAAATPAADATRGRRAEVKGA